MTKQTKVTSGERANIRLTEWEFKVAQSYGGVTAVWKRAINELAGDKSKLEQSIQQKLELIKTTEKEIGELKKRIIEIDKREEEEKKRQAEEARIKSKKSEVGVRKTISIDAWVLKWKPQFLQKLNENGGLHEIEYKSIFDKMGFKSKKEADAWIRN